MWNIQRGLINYAIPVSVIKRIASWYPHRIFLIGKSGVKISDQAVENSLT